MLKHIVFDFGGVILNLDGVHTGYPDDLAEIFNISNEDAQAIWNTNKTLVITGKESPLQFLERMKSELRLDFDVSNALTFWEERNYITRERIDWELISLIKKLKQKYQIHMLTDQIQLDNGANEWKHEFEQHFDTILRSYEQGLRKPDAAAFKNLLTKINAQPEEVVFIDDAEINCTTATKLGIHAVCYEYRNKELILEKLSATTHSI